MKDIILLETEYENMQREIKIRAYELAKESHERRVKFFSKIFKIGANIIDIGGIYSDKGKIWTIVKFEEKINDGGDAYIYIFFVKKRHDSYCRSADILFYEMAIGNIILESD